MVADAPTHTSFQILHSGSAFEAKSSSAALVLSAPLNTPNQLWSLFPNADGPWIINRGTGAYLEVENITGVALVKIELPYEWKIQNEGSSVRIESVSQKQVLQASPQGIKLSANRDAATLLTIPNVVNPILSTGSEDYLHSPEHTCVTNHVYNTVNALNGLVKILEHPDKASTIDAMAKLFTPDHYKQFKARGTEATQNLDFAREVVKAWFTAIGNKMTSDVNQKGNLDADATKEIPIRQAAEASLAEQNKTHIKTELDLTAQQIKFKTFDDDYKMAKAKYDQSVADEKQARKDYDSALSVAGFCGPDGAGASMIGPAENVSAAKKQKKGDEEKMNSKKTEREQEEKLLNGLKTQSTQEAAKIAQFEADIAKAKNIIDGNATKATLLQTHHDVLNTLYGSLEKCRTHLADSLVYNPAGGASLSVVREKVKTLVDVLQKGDDFKEPLQILDKAALDHLMTKIPEITSHASA